jgi:hypothetical protein
VDERDKDLTGLFVRDLDEIALPPRGDWRRARGRENTAMRASRYLLIAGAMAAVLAIALLAGYTLNQRQQGVAAPSASPSRTPDASPSTAGAVGSTATPSPGASARDAYNDDFGFVLTEPGAGRTTTIRRESGTRLGSFDQERFAVSPDGRQIAWFTPAGAQPQQLRIANAADVTQSQLLRTIGAAERGGTIVWSNDGSGLLYVVSTPRDTGPGPEQPATYVVHTFDMRGTTTLDRVVLTSPSPGFVLQPIAWDRAANVAAVVETGGGGFLGAYDVIRFNGTEVVTTKTEILPRGQMLAFSVSASSDAKFVLGGSIDGGAGSLLWWPIADIGARRAVTGAFNGLWRPNTHEIAMFGSCSGVAGCGTNGGLRLIDVDTGATRIVYGASTANMSLRAFRADGSAVIIYAPQAPGSDITDYTLVPVSGSTPITFKEVNGLIASVRLR